MVIDNHAHCVGTSGMSDARARSFVADAMAVSSRLEVTTFEPSGTRAVAASMAPSSNTRTPPALVVYKRPSTPRFIMASKWFGRWFWMYSVSQKNKRFVMVYSSSPYSAGSAPTSGAV